MIKSKQKTILQNKKNWEKPKLQKIVVLFNVNVGADGPLEGTS